MDQGTLIAIGAVAAVVVVALVMRSAAGRDETVAPPPGSGATEPADTADAADTGDAGAPEPDDDDWDEDEVVAVTSDGYAFLPDRHAVRMLPPDEEGEEWKAGASARRTASVAASWHSGDFTGARVARGGGDEPWRVEALGRDGEFVVFGFETRDAAEAALGLFRSRGVIRVGLDEDGNPAPPSAEQFAEARRVFEETAEALATEPGPDEERP